MHLCTCAQLHSSQVSLCSHSLLNSNTPSQCLDAHFSHASQAVAGNCQRSYFEILYNCLDMFHANRFDHHSSCKLPLAHVLTSQTKQFLAQQQRLGLTAVTTTSPECWTKITLDCSNFDSPAFSFTKQNSASNTTYSIDLAQYTQIPGGVTGSSTPTEGCGVRARTGSTPVSTLAAISAAFFLAANSSTARSTFSL